MDIRIFQSLHGDCLLVESASNAHRILCDGGPPAAMERFIAPELEKFHAANQAIDLLYISHIDQDHIGGILRLLRAAFEWTVYDFHDNNGDRPNRTPKMARVPEIKNIWHNAFRDLVSKNAGAIERQLAAAAPALQSSHVHDLEELGHAFAQIATSVPEAIEVSRLIKEDLLAIPLNVLQQTPQHSGKLIMARGGQAKETFGSLEVEILCPTNKELIDLRRGWNNWLRDPKNSDNIQKLRDKYAQALATAPFQNGTNPLDLSSWQGVAGYDGVTVPNVASLVLMVNEGPKSLLLTGDSHPDMLRDGLQAAGHLDDGFVHLDVLKFQHHGSENNMTQEFGNLVSADHYIFCGNGAHGNPELSVLDDVLASRVGAAAKRARAPIAQGRPFTFWFNTTSNVQENQEYIDHMVAVEVWAERQLQRHPGLFNVRFVGDVFETLTI